MQQMQEKGVKIIVEDFPEKIQLKQKDYKVFLKIKPEDMKKLWELWAVFQTYQN